LKKPLQTSVLLLIFTYYHVLRWISQLFITFEGTEGVGKSTQIRLVKAYLMERNLPVELVREPGGTAIGDRIRAILLDPAMEQMKMRTEILLYAASRAQLVEEKIQPMLQQGKIVLCDRYVDSSIAYQGYGAEWLLEEVKVINRVATAGLAANRTYLLDLPLAVGEQRMTARGEAKDRMELKAASFHRRVQLGYQRLAANEPRIKVIQANRTREDVFAEIKADLDHLLEKATNE
jgi:dTMP kinase